MPRPQAPRFEAPTRSNTRKPLRQTHKKVHKKSKPVAYKLLVLTGKQRTYLRGLGHDLNPLLQVGKAGLTQALLDEVGRALDSHELIKLRLLRECPDDAESATESLEKKLKANVVGKLGNVLLIYRRNPEKSRITLPTEKKAPKVAAAPIPEDFDDALDDDEDDALDGEEDE